MAAACRPPGLLDVLVKVRLEQLILHDPVFLKLTFRKCLRHFLPHLARMIEDVPFVKLEKGVQLAGPVLHRHGNVPLGLILGIIQIHRYEAIQRLQFLFGEVILRDNDIRLEVAVDSAGNVYVADTGNHTIRKVTSKGVATTLAGLAGSKGGVDGTGSMARFCYPEGVAVDKVGNVYVADSLNETIRKVTPEGSVTTLAELAGSLGSADGKGSEARFNGPQGVAVDLAGNIYVADTGNRTIRKITSAGVVTTLAGKVGSNGNADGTGSLARFGYPARVAVDCAGNVYVINSDNSTILKGSPAITTP